MSPPQNSEFKLNINLLIQAFLDHCFKVALLSPCTLLFKYLLLAEMILPICFISVSSIGMQFHEAVGLLCTTILLIPLVVSYPTVQADLLLSQASKVPASYHCPWPPPLIEEKSLNTASLNLEINPLMWVLYSYSY